jgi:four helix bundle protein
MKSYSDLEIYLMACRLALEVHKMSLTLPPYELYEQGSQVRRSSKRVKDTIVEGFGRRRYKNDFLKYLVYSQASCDETIAHLHMISEIHFQDNPLSKLIDEYEILGKKINKFIQYVEGNWRTTH